MKKKTKDLLVFPILWVKENENSMGIFRNKKEMFRCARGSEGFYNELRIISCGGIEYRIKEARKVGKGGKVDGLAFLKLFGLYEIIVEIDFFDETIERNNDELKLEILKILKSDEDYWDADGRLITLIYLIKNAKSIKETIEFVKKRYFNEPF